VTVAVKGLKSDDAPAGFVAVQQQQRQRSHAIYDQIS